MRSLLLTFFSLVILLSQTNYLAYASNHPIIPTGITSGEECNILKGMIVNQTIDSKTTMYCKFESRFLSYISKSGGITLPAESPWTDPHTGIVYRFPVVGSSPIFQNATGTYYAGENLFDIVVKPTDQIKGNDLILVPEQKKLEIISWGNGTGNSLSVSFPRYLLSGEVEVTVDENNQPFQLENSATMTTVIIPLDFSSGKQENPNPSPGFDPYLGLKSKKIEISGMQMVPEFTELKFVIFAIALTTIFLGLLRINPKQIWKRNL